MRKLLKKNRIKGIEPFNELYFKDCFFTLLFSIIIHYKKNIDPIIANESIFYENNDDKSIIRVGYEPIKDYKNVLLNIGIHVTNKITKNDFVPNIITSISENKPVIVLVDCYFEPMIMDAYKKKHLLHSALIYGYDNQTRSFDIIEFEYSDSTNYKKNIISYKDMYLAHNSEIVNEYHKKSDNVAFEFSLDNNTHLFSNSCDILIDNLKSNKIRMLESMNCFDCFLNHFENNIERIQVYPKKCLDLFIKIYNSKKIEYYRIHRILNKYESLALKQYEIMKKWSKIVTQFGIYYYNNNLNENNTKKIRESLELAYLMEIDFIDHIFKVI